MSDVPKFKTFRDLRSVPKLDVKTTTSISSTPSISSISRQKKDHTEVSPIRDFQKVPNSIPRNLDLFRGKSKQVWDYLWSVSRGAISPSRAIRKSRKEIKDSTKLGSMVTVDAAIVHLEKVGLLKVIPNIGSLGGNEYEIFTPEEIAASYTSTSSTSSTTSPTQKVVHLDVLESSTSSITQLVENKATFGDTNTSLKTNTKNDDETRINETFSAMTKRLDKAVKKLTGRGVSRIEAKKWEVVADLLILEMETAASRTGSISSAPAFLTEVLRRKLLSGNSPTHFNKSPKIKVDTVGKPNEAGEYEIKPLNEEGREAAFLKLQEFAGEDFLQDFQKWYTAEDWTWLTKELDKIKLVDKVTQNVS